MSEHEQMSTDDISSSLPTAVTKTKDFTAVAPASYTTPLKNAGGLYKPSSGKSSGGINFEVVPNMCPAKPMVLLPTNFRITTYFDDEMESQNAIVAQIEEYLKGVKGYDFDYFKDNFLWCGKHICSAAYCEIQIFLYREESNLTQKEFIIEAVKYHGDSKPFYQFYRDFKAAMTDSLEGLPILPPLFPYPPHSFPAIDREKFRTGVEPIFHMAKLPYVDTRVEALKMLSELARQPSDYLIDCSDQCIETLDEIIAFDEHSNKYLLQFAIIAYASLLPILKDMIIEHSKALPFLFVFLNEEMKQCTFETIGMLRECASILLNIGEMDSAELYKQLETNNKDMLDTFLIQLAEPSTSAMDFPRHDQRLTDSMRNLASILQRENKVVHA